MSNEKLNMPDFFTASFLMLGSGLANESFANGFQLTSEI